MLMRMTIAAAAAIRFHRCPGRLRHRCDSGRIGVTVMTLIVHRRNDVVVTTAAIVVTTTIPWLVQV